MRKRAGTAVLLAGLFVLGSALLGPLNNQVVGGWLVVDTFIRLAVGGVLLVAGVMFMED